MTDRSIKQSISVLKIAVAFSCILHLIVLSFLTAPQPKPNLLDTPLVIQLTPPPAPLTPPKPEIEQADKTLPPKTLPKNNTPIIQKQLPTAITPTPTPKQDRVIEPSLPKVIAVEPQEQIHSPIETVNQVDIPVSKPTQNNKETPPPIDIDALYKQYGQRLSTAVNKHKKYPVMAIHRGWQGEVMIEIEIDETGNVITSKIHTSSGFAILDSQALEMIKKALPFPAPPKELGNIKVFVPISFKLENPS